MTRLTLLYLCWLGSTVFYRSFYFYRPIAVVSKLASCLN